ncbi:hypothetical protein [Streptomyces sp. NPDC001404]|uniref:hypothetical protein n=1 Tax=Streptomyces sp. NPDC001404 TaxID=3364571 RepID=UPI00369D7EEF
MAALRARVLELSIAVSTHEFWGTVDAGPVVEARMPLKHVHEREDEPGGGPDSAGPA